MQTTRSLKILVILALSIATLLPRLLNLDSFRAPDEDRWMTNTSNFVDDLAHGRLTELLQLPHPGITTQWLGALTIRYDSWEIRKLPLVLAQSTLVLISGYIFAHLWGATAGVILTLLLALNPQLVAHTRIYAMDSLLALFLSLSVGTLLLWLKTNEKRHLIYSGVTGALAVLSKLPGIIIMPVAIVIIVYEAYTEKRHVLPAIGYWSLAFIITATIVLPSLAVTPKNVIGDFLEFFRSDDYTELHPAGPWYYFRTLVFFSTPLHIATLIILPVLWASKKMQRATKQQVIILLFFIALFTLQMSLGTKKGDRYLLPVFLTLDVIASLVTATIITIKVKNRWLLTTGYCLLALILWQAAEIYRLHPYTLAYVNPLMKPLLNERRTGWGEGLDIAAAYLNQKPAAEQTKVAAYYPTEFSHYFKGETVPVHQHEDESVNYVVLYRAMFERGDNAWETDVLNQFKQKAPEKTITINGIEYVWIYKK